MFNQSRTTGNGTGTYEVQSDSSRYEGAQEFSIGGEASLKIPISMVEKHLSKHSQFQWWRSISQSIVERQ